MIASVLIIAFEVPLVLRNLQITARIIGIGAGGHFFKNANTWFTDSTGAITGSPGFIGSLVVLARDRDRRACCRRGRSTMSSPRSQASASPASSRCSSSASRRRAARAFEHNLPQYTDGVTAAKIAASGKADFLAGNSHSFLSDIFSTTVFPFMLSILLFQFIGFQYSAYIAGEVRGNVRRGVMIALLGALVIGVLANSLYVDAISNHLGFGTNVSWGASYWGFNSNLSALPMGQPNSMPLLAAVANSSLWPIWALISFAGTVFPFLLCPVYINFISRMQLAWSLDRQVPEWFGRVNERLRAPAERDPRDARSHGGVPLLPELQRAAALPRDDRATSSTSPAPRGSRS